MCKKTYCDNYVEVILSMSAKILVNKSTSTPKIETSDSKFTSLTYYTQTTTWRIYQEIKKLYNRFPWVSSPSSKFIKCVTDLIYLLD